MQKEMYKINNNVERLKRGSSTLFLDGKELMDIKHKLKGTKYNIHYLYKESDHVIVYLNELPDITLFKIVCMKELRHQEIMGTLYSLGINMSYIGDILKYNNEFYMFIISEMKDYLINNFVKVANQGIKLKECDLDLLKNYERTYERISIIENSTRLDAVVSSLSKMSRSQSLTKFKNKEVTLNYNITTNNTYNLKENDIFSIRKIGKFIYRGVSKTTSKNKLILEFDKYI